MIKPDEMTSPRYLLLSESLSGSSDDNSFNDDKWSGSDLPLTGVKNPSRGQLKKMTDRMKKPFAMLRLESPAEMKDGMDSHSLGSRLTAALGRYGLRVSSTVQNLIKYASTAIVVTVKVT